MGMLRNHSGGGSGNVPDFYGAMSSASNNALSNLTQIARLGDMGLEQRIKSTKQDREDGFNKAFANAWASGDPAQLDKVMGQYSEFIPQMQQALGLKDDQHNQHVASFMMKLNSLANAGDAQGAMQLLQDNKGLLSPQDAQHLSGAISALGSKDTTKAGLAKQFLDNYSKGMIRASFKTPMQMMKSMLDENRQDETAWRDRAANAARIRGQDQRASAARAREARLSRGAAAGGVKDHTGGLRGIELARYIVDNGVMPDNSAPRESDYDWAERTLGLKKGGRAGGSTPAGQRGASSPADNLLNHDLNYLQSMLLSNPDAVAPMLGVSGGIGKPAVGADEATKLYEKMSGSTDSRKALSSAKRIQGAMQNKGIQSARDIGASGINTEAEAERFFQAMPQLDFSSQDAFQESLTEIVDYVHNWNSDDQGELSPEDQALVDHYANPPEGR